MLRYKSSLLLFILFGFFCACNPARHLPEGKFLLVKNKIQTDTTILVKDRFEYYEKQKPNRRILGFIRFHLGVYNLGISGKDTKFKKWLRKIGEEPVTVDSSMTAQTKQQFNLFLNKNGFFNAYISDSVRYHNKKAIVTYQIVYNKPYVIRSLSYTTQDTGIRPLINYYQQTSLLIPGERYDEEIIDKERDRITKDLKDRGYYFFNRNYITFQIDSSLNSHKCDIYLYINRVNENVSSSVAAPTILDHQSYLLRNIYIHTDFNPKDPSHSIPSDTVYYNGYYILSAGSKRVLKDNALIRNLFIKSGDRYLQRDLDYSYQRLQGLNIFKFINLYFKEVPRDSVQTKYLLDLQIQLTPMDKQDFTLESELTNTGGNIGIAGSFGFRNKNTFRGAEVLEFKLKGGLEAIPNFNNAEETKRLYFFNTFEIGPEVSLSLKKFLLPAFIEKKTSPYSNPKTNIVLGYNLQDRPDYRRSISNFGLSYIFSPTRRQRFIVYFPDINAVRVNLSPEFRAKLENLNDPRLLYTYETHIISSTHISWIYTDQTPGSTKDFIFFRITPELAVKAFKSSLNPSQYTKIDFDFSYHHYVNPYNNVIYHLTAGYGQPYGSSRALPFEKSFFAGGANSVRAWNTRTLGPGSYRNSINIEQSGDIKIETNFEYRSEIVQFTNGIIMEAATFIDAGNVWTRNEDISRPGGQFKMKNVLPELGIGGGAGLRFNFSFFIFRLDAAVKLRDPSFTESQRWVYPNQKFVIGDITWNLAIGYPF